MQKPKDPGGTKAKGLSRMNWYRDSSVSVQHPGQGHRAKLEDKVQKVYVAVQLCAC